MDDIRRKAEELAEQCCVISWATRTQSAPDSKEAFADLIAKALRQARLEENLACEECCAKLGPYVVAKECATAIAKRRGEE